MPLLLVLLYFAYFEGTTIKKRGKDSKVKIPLKREPSDNFSDYS